MKQNRSIPAATGPVILGDVRGAEILDEPRDHVYGERQYTAADPWGHQWTFSESIDDVHPETWGGILREE